MFVWFAGADEFVDAKTSYLPVLGSEVRRFNIYGLIFLKIICT